MNAEKRRRDFGVGNFLSSALDFFYPPRCLNCGKGLWLFRHAYLCEDCERDVELLGDNVCNRCGEILGLYARGLCWQCRRVSPLFTRAISAARYRDNPTSALIKHFKYHDQRNLARPFAEILAARCRRFFDLAKIDFLIPVPLHSDREYVRGYNQAELLAKALADNLRLPMVAALRRTRPTPPQARQTVRARLENLRGAFAPARPLNKGAKVMLIDDVLSTGATVGECARVLRQAGAYRVFVATFAR